jgi:hypothetical protein
MTANHCAKAEQRAAPIEIIVGDMHAGVQNAENDEHPSQRDE